MESVVYGCKDSEKCYLLVMGNYNTLFDLYQEKGSKDNQQ